MDHLITVREYSELRLENMRLHNELDMQKQLYDKILNDFQIVLKDTNDIYIKELYRLHTIIGDSDQMEIPSVPSFPPQTISSQDKASQTALSSLTTSNIPSNVNTSSIPDSNHTPNPAPTILSNQTDNKKVSKQKSSNVLNERSNCIQDHTKRAPHPTTVNSFSESALKKHILSSLQKNTLEELMLVSLAPKFTPDNIQLVVQVLFTAMKKSLSLLKTFDTTEVLKRVDLFSSLLFYLSTRFLESEIADFCLTSIQEELMKELHSSLTFLKQERFSPSFIALLLIYYDLCRYFNAIEMFKVTLYNIFTRAGEFPLQVVSFLYLRDSSVLQELSLFDCIINCIIGETFSSNASQLQNFSNVVSFFNDMHRDWTKELQDIETSSLQTVIDNVNYSIEDDRFNEAGRALVLIYAYRGGEYAVNSLLSNGIIQNIENSELSVAYRQYLVYLILWIAEIELFGSEWVRIKEVLESTDVLTQPMKSEYSYLF